MLAAEPALLRPAADAPVERIVQTGALFLPERDELPPALERFCAAGPPPVYIGFGSMPDRDPARSTAMLVEAIRRAGVRAVIGRGWAGLGGVELPPEVHVVDDVPHGKLFPLLGAVVHHGGTGTTSNAARAGIPQVLVPHLLDQFYVADRLGPLGLGPRAIPRKRLTVARLAHALAEVVGDPGYRERAGALAQQVVRDGVERAVVMLEELGAGRPVRATVSAAG
jgi:vancomycin aglycone glucosyltransferase